MGLHILTEVYFHKFLFGNVTVVIIWANRCNPRHDVYPLNFFATSEDVYSFLPLISFFQTERPTCSSSCSTAESVTQR